MKIVVMTGPPYSGKGTQCSQLEKTLGYKHLSTGDYVRAEMESSSELGQQMEASSNAGGLATDAQVQVLLDRLIREHRDAPGIILDGYPRTVPQVDRLLAVMEAQQLHIEHIINIDVPREELLQRAAKRAVESKRKDDQGEEKHQKRLAVFLEETKPAIAYLQTKMAVHTVDGIGKPEEIMARILKVLQSES